MTVAHSRRKLPENIWAEKEYNFLLKMQEKMEKAIKTRQDGTLNDGVKMSLFTTKELQTFTASFYTEKEREEDDTGSGSEEETNLSEEYIYELVSRTSDFEGRNQLIRDNLADKEKQLKLLEEIDEDAEYILLSDENDHEID